MPEFICGGSSAGIPLPVSSRQLGQVRHSVQLTQSNPATRLTAQAVEFFETSALLITFIALGKLLEGAAKGRTSRVRFGHPETKICAQVLSCERSCALCWCLVQRGIQRSEVFRPEDITDKSSGLYRQVVKPTHSETSGFLRVAAARPARSSDPFCPAGGAAAAAAGARDGGVAHSGRGRAGGAGGGGAHCAGAARRPAQGAHMSFGAFQTASQVCRSEVRGAGALRGGDKHTVKFV